MSGVIDANGVQWERCTCCTRWVRFDDLGYLPPQAHRWYIQGADICLDCTNNLGQAMILHVIPAKGWQRAYS